MFAPLRGIRYTGCMPKNAKRTKQRILAAAISEFSAHGVAGARVDRVATAAECNKQMIYIYFGSKEKLFEAVFKELSEKVLKEVEFTPYNIVDYIGKLCDLFERHPEVVRLVSWCRLERRGDRAPEILFRDRRKRVEAVRRAQEDGAISKRFDADDLLGLLGSLTINHGLSLAEAKAAPLGERARREAILRAVHLMTDP